MNESDMIKIEPWYKQFWPLFLIALPGSVIIACIFLIVLSFKTADDVITKDYYQKGLNINHVLEQLQFAKSHNIKIDGRIDGQNLSLMLSGDHTDSGDLLVQLSETSDKQRDVSIVLSRQEDGSFQAALPDNIRAGRFYIDVSPADNAQWLIKGVIFLPTTSFELLP